VRVLGALALKLAVLPDDDALARIRHRLTPRRIGGERLEVVPPPQCIGTGVLSVALRRAILVKWLPVSKRE
jgi:hypothetical protein